MRQLTRGQLMSVRINRVARAIQHVIFPAPPGCSLCHRPTPAGWTSSVCDRCLERLPTITKLRCRQCGRAMNRRPVLQCSECRFKAGAVDYSRAFGVYDGYLSQVIHRLKFQGELRMAQGLGELMAWIVAADGRYGRIDAVVPVPLHPARLHERGYNQAEALAQVVARELGKAMVQPTVRRQEGTPQAKLSWKERRTYVQRAFSVHVPERVRGRRLLLVDDVWTTGSTLSALALALKRAGARRCTSICAAASSLDHEFASDTTGSPSL